MPSIMELNLNTRSADYEKCSHNEKHNVQITWLVITHICMQIITYFGKVLSGKIYLEQLTVLENGEGRLARDETSPRESLRNLKRDSKNLFPSCLSWPC